LKKIIFLGSKPIGYECFKFLVQKKDILEIDIVGIHTNENAVINNNKSLLELARKHKIYILNSTDEILNIQSDFIISVQYHKILKLNHIKSASILAFNLHMAPLPELRGCNQFSFALYKNIDRFGTTLHVIDEDIDSGDIIFEKRFKIPKNCFVDELYNLTFRHSCNLFYEKVPLIFKNKYKLTTQESLISDRGTSIHFRKEIIKLKEINLDEGIDELKRKIRSTSMPGFEPPFFMFNNKKFYITSKIKYE
tara:strand:- start:1320 stop:2072 length:753 start_codon:yes stop_codon:yes gene_type:complete